MESILIVVVAFVGYLVAYNTYGRYLSQKVFRLDADNQTPSRELEDGVDYVPTKKQVIFGHHFTSIAGTGPIVGPAIGIIWGWVPALMWIFLGSVFMGAVHDLGALVISLRHKGHTMAEITGMVMNRRLKIMFFIIVFLALLIVIAIFGLVIAVIFDMYPAAVLPVWLQIPIAIAMGRAIRSGTANLTKITAVAVAAMYGSIALGYYLPLPMPEIFGLPSTGVWTILLLVYAYVASTLSVTTLLQPRDFINAWQLMVAMALLVLGVFIAAPVMVAPAFNLSPEGAPPWMPFLFITIACGAISGFHCLVSSGTSSKQVESEPDARFVGYGSMLTEGFLATIVLIACGGGLALAYTTTEGQVLTGSAAFATHYGSWMASSGLASKVAAFSSPAHRATFSATSSPMTASAVVGEQSAARSISRVLAVPSAEINRQRNASLRRLGQVSNASRATIGISSAVTLVRPDASACPRATFMRATDNLLALST